MVFNPFVANNTTWKMSKDGVFSGPHFPVFGLNIGKYGPEKNSLFGHFSCSAKFPFYFPRLKAPENIRFSSVFRGYNLEALATNG